MCRTAVRTSPHLPRPGIHASMSYFRYAEAPSSSVGMSSTLHTVISVKSLEPQHSTYRHGSPSPWNTSSCTALISSIMPSLSAISPRVTANSSTLVN